MGRKTWLIALALISLIAFTAAVKKPYHEDDDMMDELESEEHHAHEHHEEHHKHRERRHLRKSFSEQGKDESPKKKQVEHRDEKKNEDHHDERKVPADVTRKEEKKEALPDPAGPKEKKESKKGEDMVNKNSAKAAYTLVKSMLGKSKKEIQAEADQLEKTDWNTLSGDIRECLKKAYIELETKTNERLGQYRDGEILKGKTFYDEVLNGKAPQAPSGPCEELIAFAAKAISAGVSSERLILALEKEEGKKGKDQVREVKKSDERPDVHSKEEKNSPSGSGWHQAAADVKPKSPGA